MLQLCSVDLGKKSVTSVLYKTTNKTAAMVNDPRPQSVAEVHSFLGFVNYYYKFLPNLATILHPLN
jgi:hypothetical protein